MKDEQIKSLVQSLEETNVPSNYSGNILVARGEKVLFEKSFGFSSFQDEVPNHRGTRFNLGSLNKMFTAILIGKLIQEKRASLDQKLTDIIDLEDWTYKRRFKNITILHLLSHTSGLGDYFNSTFWKSSRDLFVGLNDYKKLWGREDKPLFSPGKGFHYSNWGFYFLGLILEELFKSNYYELSEEEIFNPLGMEKTLFPTYDQCIPQLAFGYFEKENESKIYHNTFIHVFRGGPAGGGISTVDDLHKFAIALQKNELLLGTLFNRMTSYTSPWNSRFGLGFMRKEFTNREGQLIKLFGHSGKFWGIECEFWFDPKSELIFILLSNFKKGRDLLKVFQSHL